MVVKGGTVDVFVIRVVGVCFLGCWLLVVVWGGYCE